MNKQAHIVTYQIKEHREPLSKARTVTLRGKNTKDIKHFINSNRFLRLANGRIIINSIKKI